MTDMDQRASGALLITAPTEQERLFTMAVRLPRAQLKPRPGRRPEPWLAIRANTDTEQVTCAAGTTAKKKGAMISNLIPLIQPLTVRFAAAWGKAHAPGDDGEFNARAFTAGWLRRLMEFV